MDNVCGQGSCEKHGTTWRTLPGEGCPRCKQEQVVDEKKYRADGRTIINPTGDPIFVIGNKSSALGLCAFLNGLTAENKQMRSDLDWFKSKAEMVRLELGCDLIRLTDQLPQCCHTAMVVGWLEEMKKDIDTKFKFKEGE